MRFVADVMLANLGRWLRILGFDTLIATESQSDDEVLAISKNRILLTRDKNMFSKAQAHGLDARYIENRAVLEQLRFLNLKINFPESTRCPKCNGELEVVQRPKTVPSRVRSATFWKCKNCGKDYWQGSHWRRIEEMVKKLQGLD